MAFLSKKIKVKKKKLVIGQNFDLFSNTGQLLKKNDYQSMFF